MMDRKIPRRAAYWMSAAMVSLMGLTRGAPAPAIGIGAADTGDDGHETSEEVAFCSQFVRPDGDDLFVLYDAGERRSRCGDQGHVGLRGKHDGDPSRPVARACRANRTVGCRGGRE